MRGNILKGTGGKMNGQFYSLFHRDEVWPKFLVFIIIIFYTTIFTLFALSYVYIFSGFLGSGNNGTPSQMIHSRIDVSKSLVTIPEAITSSIDMNVIQPVSDAETATSVPHTNVQINGTHVSVADTGSVHKNISTGLGNASFDVTMQSNGSSNADSFSSVDLTVGSSSRTVSEVK
jgi:hypothetical protein